MISRKLQLGSSVWLDLTDASSKELMEFCRGYGLTEQLAEECLDPSALPKLTRIENSTFIMLRCFDTNAKPHASSAQDLTRKLAMIWGDGVLITIHRAPLPWMEHVWAQAEKGGGNAGTVVFHLVEECLYTFEQPIDADGEAITALEERIFQERSTRAAAGEMLSTAYLVKKRAFTFKRLLRLSRDLLPGLSKLGDPGSPQIQTLKEEAERLFFYSDDLAESANDLVQLSISMSSNRMNELVRMLTIVSIFLLPLNLITGIYGMNFEFMPEVKHPWGYPIALTLMASILVVTYLVLRRRGWIRTRE